MCGILGLFGNENTNIDIELRNRFLRLSKLIRHRGPDWNGIYTNTENNVIISHERLSIVGLDNGSQPIVSNDQTKILSVNGEIYNYQTLAKFWQGKYDFTTDSDCEVVIPLIQELGVKGINLLDGIFSFVYYDSDKNYYVIARDPIGVTPLYYGYTCNRELMVCSEMKSLQEDCIEVFIFPPGHYMTSEDESPVRYYTPKWIDNINPELTLTHEEYQQKINSALTEAVEKRLMCDVPFGVLLSGGLDSSLIASISNRILKQRESQWGNKLHSFSIGLKGAPDLIYAKKVADFLGTIHHEYNFEIQEGIDCLEDLIYNLETYDVTTIRASTPMYLLSRKIKAFGIKMVLSGEGADEVFGGYLYFHSAPTSQEFNNECLKRVMGLHCFDCLRANKSTMSWGLEARVPFLDKHVLDLCMPIPGNVKLSKRDSSNNNIEKYILRKAFDTPDDPYLPEEILWRQKEQFSDGVGYSWIDSLIEYATNQISDIQLENASTKYPYNTPKTKEAYFYRQIFEKQFPGRDGIIPRWIPRTDWDGVGEDPSGRAQKVHNDSKKLI